MVLFSNIVWNFMFSPLSQLMRLEMVCTLLMNGTMYRRRVSKQPSPNPSRPYRYIVYLEERKGRDEELFFVNDSMLFLFQVKTIGELQSLGYTMGTSAQCGMHRCRTQASCDFVLIFIYPTRWTLFFCRSWLLYMCISTGRMCMSRRRHIRIWHNLCWRCVCIPLRFAAVVVYMFLY